MPVSGKKIIKLLLERGWSIKSQKGSHVKMVKDGKMVAVPMHGNRDLGFGLVKAIERQTGEKLL